jgi:hypothetical protein
VVVRIAVRGYFWGVEFLSIIFNINSEPVNLLELVGEGPTHRNWGGGQGEEVGVLGCRQRGESEDPPVKQFASKMFGKAPPAPTTAAPWPVVRGGVAGPMEAAGRWNKIYFLYH